MNNNYSEKKAMWCLIGTAMAGLMVGFDFSIVNVCVPSIQRGLMMSISQLQWIMAGFGIMFSTLLVVMGRLGDLYGYKKVFYIGMVGFVLASIAAALATSGMMLIIGRVFQGFFGASIFSIGHGLGDPRLQQ